MLKDLSPAARQLADFMSELSEKAYHAGWMKGLEYALWLAVTEGPRQYGRLSITAQQVKRLKELADACGGWIVFDDEEGETWLTSEEWKARWSRNSDCMRSCCS